MPITSGPPDAYPVDDSPNAFYTTAIAQLVQANVQLGQVALETARIRVAEDTNAGLDLTSITTYAQAGP